MTTLNIDYREVTTSMGQYKSLNSKQTKQSEDNPLSSEEQRLEQIFFQAQIGIADQVSRSLQIVRKTREISKISKVFVLGIRFVSGELP